MLASFLLLQIYPLRLPFHCFCSQRKDVQMGAGVVGGHGLEMGLHIIDNAR